MVFGAVRHLSCGALAANATTLRAMMIPKFVCLGIAVGTMFLSACSPDPRHFKITDQNKDRFMEELKTSRGLAVEEVGLLQSYHMRQAASKALGGTPSPPVGKTVGDLIEEERKFQADAKAKEAEREKLAAEAKAKADAVTEQMRGAIQLTVFDKGFIPSNLMGGRYNDYITVKCVYENKSAKGIRAFRGTVKFTDLFDREIYSSTLTISNPIGSGEKANWSGTIEYNQFKSEHQQLRNADLKDMKVVWFPESIIFDDGRQISADQVEVK
jgi:hypothetical protein